VLISLRRRRGKAEDTRSASPQIQRRRSLSHFPVSMVIVIRAFDTIVRPADEWLPALYVSRLSRVAVHFERRFGVGFALLSWMETFPEELLHPICFGPK